MLTKTSTIILGVIYQQPINAYEIIKTLGQLHVSDWYEIADSTVYATLKTLEKKNHIVGTIKKDGNMPDKTVYSITETGHIELKTTISFFITKFEYDIIPFIIANFFIGVLTKEDALSNLNERLGYLKNYSVGILKQIGVLKSQKVPALAICNVEHNAEIIQSEIDYTEKLIETIKREKGW